MDTGEVGCPDGRVGLARVALAVLFAWQAWVDGGGSGGVVHSQRLDLAEEDAWLESASVPANMAGRAEQTNVVVVDRKRHSRSRNSNR